MGKKSGRAKDNQIKKEHLLDPNGQYGLSDKFRLCLSEVFERFDEGKDGALSRDELQNFAVAANAGNNLQDDEVTQLQQFFETNSKGELTLKGFMQMYHMQTTARSSDTWKDLQRLGYLPNLEPASGPRPPQASTPPAAEKPAAAAEAPAAAAEVEAPPKPESKADNQKALIMDELRAALAAMKGQPESADAHRRVGAALKALGRDEAAARSMQQADTLEGKEAAAAVSVE
uniref:EF-hand domain-containing protein n=1 Tax=Prymnesium polylepis TaxID=72548 RepID=A0A6V3YNE6_9EUKA|mmetsp:Transcript_16370/g.41434  ORF Transcript_16370/g.41434 Transcript_16370/m.41434 type:complete len:231 (+) Transcript_16370:88-780(+)